MGLTLCQGIVLTLALAEEHAVSYYGYDLQWQSSLIEPMLLFDGHSVRQYWAVLHVHIVASSEHNKIINRVPYMDTEAYHPRK